MKVLFDLSRNQVALEGDSPDLMALLQLVRDVAPKLTEIRIITNTQNPRIAEQEQQNGGGSNGAEGEVRRQGAPTLREFARSIGPTTLTERIIAIAAYHKRHAGRDTFSPKEMSDWFTICGFQKPAQMSVALFDAKRKYGFLDKAGHGQWRLSTAGDNVVTRKLEESRVNAA